MTTWEEAIIAANRKPTKESEPVRVMQGYESYTRDVTLEELLNDARNGPDKISFAGFHDTVHMYHEETFSEKGWSEENPPPNYSWYNAYYKKVGPYHCFFYDQN